MKIQVLNEDLVEEGVCSVFFPFSPIAIPVDDKGVVVDKNEAVKAHFISLVYVCIEDTLKILEYPSRIYEGLQAYNSRNEDVRNIRIVMSRYEDKRIKMTSAGMETSPLKKDAVETWLPVQQNLFKEYCDKQNYIVHDYE